MKAISRAAAPAFICDLLQKRGRARALREQLSARVVAKSLGQTTGFLYHHWGSFDAFLFEVSGIGWRRLVDAIVASYARSKDPRAIVLSYVDFAVDNPVLYWLLAERPLSVPVVRATLEAGSELPSFAAFLDYFKLVASVEPGTTIASARAMHAAAHGLASQLLSRRLGSTPDALRRDEREIAQEIAGVIAERFFPIASSTSSTARERRSPARDPKAASPPRRRKTRPDSPSRRS